MNALPPEALTAEIQRQSAQPASPALQALQEAVLTQYGDTVQAILFYGSCLRSGDALDGLVDLYVVVESYRTVYRRRWLRLGNALLPPNVFYLEVPFAERLVRAKYAVLSLNDLRRGVRRWFQSYLWGRFAQPTGLLYAHDEAVAQQIVQALVQAVMTFVDRTLPLVPLDFDAAELWQTGLAHSYRTELRAERPERTRQLLASSRDYYEQVTRAALAAKSSVVSVIDGDGFCRYYADITGRERRRCRLAWRIRQVQGKLLSLLRLMKAAFTFRGGLDYILWKLERHSGVKIELTPRQRRHPLLFGWSALWRLYRQGMFR
ncbi:MAG TPA: hypothetical protein VES89_05960 [Candidatus Competibacteraceae bacterium]|nr:hypothetical protein [Candidatus Competibacteraceae bacterium]